MNNQRHYKRHAVTCNGYITDNMFLKIRFNVNNISASGMDITTAIELKNPQILTFHFEAYGLHLPFTRPIKGKVVRNHSYCKYGIQFTELTHDDTIEIDEYLRFIQNNAKYPQYSYSNMDEKNSR